MINYCSIYATDTEIATLDFTLGEEWQRRFCPLVLRRLKPSEALRLFTEKSDRHFIAPHEPTAENQKKGNFWVDVLSQSGQSHSIAPPVSPIQGVFAHEQLVLKGLMDDQDFAQKDNVKKAIQAIAKHQSTQFLAYLQAATYARKKLIGSRWVSEV